MKFEYCEVIDLTLPITSGMDIPTGLRATLPPVEFKLYSRAEEQGLQVEREYIERYLIDALAVDDLNSYMTEITVRLLK